MRGQQSPSRTMKHAQEEEKERKNMKSDMRGTRNEELHLFEKRGKSDQDDTNDGDSESDH